ncbi:E4 protein [Human papillomavirus 204]|uniref:E4 protein n=1 Tax=Human papillomavirus 204 TaxID=1650736 RepID=A0A0F7CUG2_9PAPI|nr:E4 protein [Human papillomavirus 204]AKG54928.1 E4 protein [Human papillomavirus 204]
MKQLGIAERENTLFILKVKGTPIMYLLYLAHLGLLGLLTPPKPTHRPATPGAPRKKALRDLFDLVPTDNDLPPAPGSPPDEEENKENQAPEQTPTADWRRRLLVTLGQELRNLQEEINQDFEFYFRRLGIH